MTDPSALPPFENGPRRIGRGVDRRRFLLGAAAATGTWVAGSSRGFAAPLGMERRTKRIVVIAFGGGVRTRETFGMPSNVPNLEALAGRVPTQELEFALGDSFWSLLDDGVEPAGS